MDVVYEENIVLAVTSLKFQRGVGADGVDEIVGELLTRNVTNPHARVLFLHVLPHRVQEVSLPEPHSPIYEERVVHDARRLGDGKRRRVCEAVAGPDHERVEGVFGLERPW